MKQTLARGISTFLLSLFAIMSFNSVAEEAPDSLNTLIPQLANWGKDPTIVAAVEAQNKKNMSLDSIKKMDDEWQVNSGVSDFMNSLMNNSAAKKLMEFESSQPYLVELFLMDNKGANVAMTNKTSDYWQGDEAKFQKSFNDGKGSVFIGPVEYDDSALAYLVQISVPVMDNDGSTVGAITIGVNLDEYEEQQ